MAIPYKNLRLRLLTALVGVPLVVGFIYWNAWTYFILFGLILLGTLIEYYGLIRQSGITPLTYWGIVSGLCLYTSGFLYAKGSLATPVTGVSLLILWVPYWVVLYKKNDPMPFHTLAHTLLGIFYIVVPFICLHQLAFYDAVYHSSHVLGILMMVWANDIGAYFFGSWLGRHKLFKRISPKKTWEGTLAGALLTLLVSQCLARCIPTFSPLVWLAMGSIIAVIGTYGDLLESLLKRSLNMKDSGRLLPGHGGFLDRFDSLLLALPILVAFLKVHHYLYS